ncbi:hypothetical protein AAFF_G00429840 [Aldrovandia affinis]|uniref:Uncharacterized protein n=1 Tax=Aldrovandia affinis TaxID=143900 RepID=A0AAD7S8X8_9TELE|nr:hypothetical protein AAFF_G00429840 [Aldrovandia affinis]
MPLIKRTHTRPLLTQTHTLALGLLSEQRLSDAKHILIHTGTNGLSTCRIDIAKALRQVAAKATQEPPAAKVTISTLLPRLDVPQQVIHSINAEVSRGCDLLPNVHPLTTTTSAITTSTTRCISTRRG